MQTNRKRKIIIVIAAVIALISIATLIGVGIMSVYTARHLNLEVDERMFAKSAAWSSTSFYADADLNDDRYTPVKVEVSGSLKKVFYPLEEISPYLKKGFIAVEDKIFYEHHGVDIKRTVYAALNYIFGKGKSFGASTITQQVIKNISGDNQPTVSRKLAEMIRAANIEQSYSKDEILEVYLNVIPMSENIYGVGLASRTYFGKEPSELTAAEAATLIGITNATTAYNPYKNPDACLAKRNTVLSVMRDDGVISDSEYAEQASLPLSLVARADHEDKYDSWFTETVIEDISADYAEKYNISHGAAKILLLGGGYSVYTTMDTAVQRILDETFSDASSFPTGISAAMVVTDAQSGELRAIVGGAGEKTANRLLNHATVPHTPASTLKPLALYAPLLDEGIISWSTVFDDVPVSFSEQDGTYVEYPRNSPGVYDGLTTVSEAVRLSKNTVAVRLYELMGAERVFSGLIDNFGISTLVRRKSTEDGRTLTDLSSSPLALGQLTDGIPLRKLTEAYGVFPSGGVLNECISYLNVNDSDGNVILESEAEKKRVFSGSTAAIMNKLLSQVTGSGTARSITLKNVTSVAGKTGTSGGNLDKLFVGYTPYYVAGIWCGGNNGGAVPTSFSHLAIWDKVMLAVHSSLPDGGISRKFSEDGLLYRPYCMDSGELYSDNCIFDPRGSRMAYGYFNADNMPRTLCTRHIICDYDGDGKGIAGDNCPKKSLVEVSLISVPNRAFPTEVYVTDGEYVWRGDIPTEPYSEDSYTDLPYFYPALPDGEYSGITKRQRQFNARCHKHITPEE